MGVLWFEDSKFHSRHWRWVRKPYWRFSDMPAAWKIGRSFPPSILSGLLGAIIAFWTSVSTALVLNGRDRITWGLMAAASTDLQSRLR